MSKRRGNIENVLGPYKIIRDEQKADSNNGFRGREVECKKKNETSLLLLKKLRYGVSLLIPVYFLSNSGTVTARFSVHNYIATTSDCGIIVGYSKRI